MLTSLFVVVVVTATAGITALIPPPRPTCVWNCQGEPDSQRPNCADCSKFTLCLGGSTFNYTCPQGLHYDKDRGLCNWAQDVTCGNASAVAPPPTSLLIHQSPNPHQMTSSLRADHACITSCDGMEDGNYHSCQGCDVFATCSAGSITDGRMCPVQTIWDDVSKECNYTSRTCDVTQADTVDDVTRSDTVDDVTRSSTADDVTRSSTVGVTRDQLETTETIATSTEEDVTNYVTSECLSSCVGVSRGLYQWCRGCSWYVICHDDYPWLFRCMADYKWDSDSNNCFPTSTTCTELTPETDLPLDTE